MSMQSYEGKLSAPDFPEDLEWLNVDRPLHLRELRGKVVLLGFWAYCRVSCLSILPELKRLERKYPSELVVVGVHSGKFSQETQGENIRKAILRFEIEHPVINDADMVLWSRYGVKVWPTAVLLDPLGKVVWSMAGQDIYEPFDELISMVVQTFEKKRRLDRTPLSVGPDAVSSPATALAFPGKLLVDPILNRLFVSDSNHHRILVIGLEDQRLQMTIGSGMEGFSDGDSSCCEFCNPQGLALVDGLLYVADAGNHAIRAVNIEMNTVVTVAGTGRQAKKPAHAGAGKLTSLNVPWDLAAAGHWLYIANAGSHQIWRLALDTGRIEAFAGTGEEARVDGPVEQAAFAEPSGLATDGRRLYVADSETSSIREIDLQSRQVRTIVGGDLFDFGDVDGSAATTRLQHPMGLAYHDNRLYVADTYNNKIKLIDLASQTCRTLAGSGQSGLEDGIPGGFHEPAGLGLSGEKLYVADTNTSAVRTLDLITGEVATLHVQGLEESAETGETEATGDLIKDMPLQTVLPGPVTLSIALDLPAGLAINPTAANTVRVFSPNGAILSAGLTDRTISRPTFPLLVVVDVPAGPSELLIDLPLYYYRLDKQRLSYFKRSRLRVPIFGAADGQSRLRVHYRPGHLG